MSKFVDKAGLATALDGISTSAVYFKEVGGDIITPNTRCYTKAEVDFKLGELDKKKLDRGEYDKTLEEVLKVTGYKDIEEFSEEKTYYQGDLVKVRELDSEGNIIWTYYRYTKVHTPSLFITSDCVQTNLYQEIQSLKQLDVETVYLHISTEKGGVTLSDYHITYKYDGQVYYADISSNGECQFSVPKGKEYTIIFPQFEGYAQKASMNLYASINTKSIEVYYSVLRGETELATIKGTVYNAAYGAGDDAAKAEVLENAEFTLIVEGETREVKKFDSNFLVYFNVPIGYNYVIKCSPVQGYMHSNTTETVLATSESKRFDFSFIQITTSTGSEWMAISSTGKLYNLDAISSFSDNELKALDLVALRLGNSTLSGYNAEFWVPLIYKYNGGGRLVTSYLSGQWYKSNVQLDPSYLPNCSTANSLQAGYYPSIQGEENTKRLRYLASASTYSTISNWKNFKIVRVEQTEDILPDIILEQTCGDNAYWVVKDSILYILGQGATYSYESFETTPWASYIGTISGIVIGPDITVIGSYSFQGFSTTAEGTEFTKVICFATTPPSIDETVFSTYTPTLYVPNSSYTIQDSQMIRICDLCILDINGYKCTPFIPAINQLVQLQANRAVFQNFYLKWYKAKYGVNGSISYPNSALFWSSSQGNALRSYLLYDGRLGDGGKDRSFNVVPFFALSPQAVANS